MLIDTLELSPGQAKREVIYVLSQLLYIVTGKVKKDINVKYTNEEYFKIDERFHRFYQAHISKQEELKENVRIYLEKLMKSYENAFDISEDAREPIRKDIEKCINWLPPDIKGYYRVQFKTFSENLKRNSEEATYTMALNIVTHPNKLNNYFSEIEKSPRSPEFHTKLIRML